MAPQEITALAAEVDALDRETARRVARLVVECRATLPLALQAVDDAKHGAEHDAPTRPIARGGLTRLLAYIGGSRSRYAYEPAQF